MTTKDSAKELMNEVYGEEQWEEIEQHDFPSPHDFDETPVLVGVLAWTEVVDTTGFDGQPRTARFYCLVTDAGEAGFWGTANLDKLMVAVKRGDRIRVEYMGTDRLTRGRSMRRFKVSIARRP